MVGQFWEVNTTVISDNSVQGYLALTFHRGGIKWADLRFLDIFFSSAHILGGYSVLCAETVFLVGTVASAFYAGGFPATGIMKRQARSKLWVQNRPSGAYSGLLWLRL